MEPTLLVLGVFVLLWWVAFLALLPVGVRSQEEAGHVEPGTSSSAPVSPGLARKSLYAAAIAALMTVALAVLSTQLPPIWNLLDVSV